MGRNGSSLLSGDDINLFLEIAETCHSVTSREFTATVYPRLRELLPHEGFVCAAVHPIHGQILRYINISFPQHHLDLCDPIGTNLDCALVKKWIRVGRPVFHEKSDLVRHNRNTTGHRNDLAPLHNVAIHGIVNGPRRHASCYVFSNLDEAWHPRQALILKLITPHLHTLFMPVLRGEIASPALRKPLSKREHSVMEPLMMGKTSKEIADMLNISRSTVRVHIRHILVKFNTHSIVGAVAKAYQAGLHTPIETNRVNTVDENPLRARRA